ncbi:hypothetical protein ANN_15922 [Periplaneta americana]|uniref:Uncharacterized protein n=1 Tax=Periplaneta americana TaxID=6978 RepID=A0ABQ8SIX3_PERAM|nr:hypothetical protein ANN_15922 [Periplaneta americana]
MSPGFSTESYPAFAYIGMRENPGKNLNQVTCLDRELNPGHLVSRSDALTRREIRTHDQRPAREQIARASRSTDGWRGGERGKGPRDEGRSRAQLLTEGRGNGPSRLFEKSVEVEISR